jgi:hypothetical protein
MEILKQLFWCGSSEAMDREEIQVTEANAAYYQKSAIGNINSAVRLTKEARALRVLYLCRHGRLPE